MTRRYADCEDYDPRDGEDYEPRPVEDRCTCGPTSSGPCRFCDGSDDPPVDEEAALEWAAIRERNA